MPDSARWQSAAPVSTCCVATRRTHDEAGHMRPQAASDLRARPDILRPPADDGRATNTNVRKPLSEALADALS